MTQRDRASTTPQQHLTFDETLYAAIFATLAEGIVVIDADGVISAANPAAERILGLPAGSAGGQAFFDLDWEAVAEDGVMSPNSARQLRSLLGAGQPVSGALIGLRRADGTRVRLEVNARPAVVPGNSRPAAFVVAVTDITERHESERELRRSRKLYETLASNLPNGVVALFDHDLRYTLVEGSGLATVGLSRERMVGRTVAEVFPARLAAVIEPHYRAALAGEERTFELRFGQRAFEVTVLPLRDEGGAMVAGLAMPLEITRREQAEQDERRLRHELEMVVTHSPDAIARFDRDLRHTFANEALAQALGSPLSTIVGRTIAEVGRQSELTRLWSEAVARCFSSGEHQDIEFEYPTPNGLRWFQSHVVPETDASGAVLSVLAVSRDITARKEIEGALRASEERFRGAFERAAVGITIRALDGTLLRVNERYCRLLGMTEAEIFASEARAFGPFDYLPSTVALRERLLRGEIDTFTLERRMRHKLGHELVLSVHVSLVHDLDGQPLQFVAQVLDVTEQRQAEAALRESERRFRAAFDSAAVGMGLVGLDGRWLQVNPALCTILGYDAEELLAGTFQAVTHPDDLAEDLAHIERLLDGSIDAYNLEKRYLHREGRVIWSLLSRSLVRDEGGTPLYFISQVQDITRRKQLEAQLTLHAFHDPLTGLPNRAYFTERLEGALARYRRNGASLAVLFLDLDGFKAVNDTLGHSAGDRVLQQVGTRLQRCVRPNDMVARMGGDELTILLEDVTVPDAAASAAARLIAEVSMPYSIADGQDIWISASIGIAFPDSSSTADSLLQRADAALYQAKAAGKGRFVVAAPVGDSPWPELPGGVDSRA